jgi:hypothetical protein
MIARIVTGSGRNRQTFDLPRAVAANGMNDVRERLAIGNVVKGILFGKVGY